MKRNRKKENPTQSFREMNLVLSSYKNCKVKVKLWWIVARERNKRVFFVPFILSEGSFFNICGLSQCVVHWLQLQKNSYFYLSKNITPYTFLLNFKTVESLQSILKQAIPAYKEAVQKADYNYDLIQKVSRRKQ